MQEDTQPEVQSDVQQTSLNDILSGQEQVQQPPEPVQTEPEVQPEPEPEAEPQTDVKAEEAQPVEPSSTEENVQQVPLKALEAERHKRQELERQIQEFQTPAEEVEPIDPFLEPDQFVQQTKTEISDEMFQMKTEMSQEMMRSTHQDYDEMEALFMEKVQDPKYAQVLSVGLRSAPMPAKYAYETAKTFKELENPQPANGPSDELKAQWKAEYLESLKEAETTKAVEAAPKSLADAPSADSRKDPAWEGPKPLSSILKE